MTTKFRSGEHWIWFNAAAVAISLLLLAGLLSLLLYKGLGHFWPSAVAQLTLSQQQTVFGEVIRTETVPSEIHSASASQRYLLRQGQREVHGQEFNWFSEADIVSWQYPSGMLVLKRSEWGNLYGIGLFITEQHERIAAGDAVVSELQSRIRHSRNGFSASKQSAALHLQLADGSQIAVPVADIVQAYQPNSMTLWQKLTHYVSSFWLFLTDGPRDANTEGGIFPAIFGTVVTVLLMAVIVTPIGVMAAVYLHEYAGQGWWVRLLRISVYNLAGVPSVVFGIFGLGFFVYIVGGSIDQLFFADQLPAPVFGTPGLLWVSLTLALLTLPVVIVATEEGLARIPKELRLGCYALGATKAEMLWRIVLPQATPAMMTGLILAISRAAGEVAPLIFVGVVKLAPALPVDSEFPYIHLDRKIMHLGYHIYDTGFQSTNIDAAEPLVYMSAIILIGLILSLNLLAFTLRSRLLKKYQQAQS